MPTLLGFLTRSPKETFGALAPITDAGTYFPGPISVFPREGSSDFLRNENDGSAFFVYEWDGMYLFGLIAVAFLSGSNSLFLPIVNEGALGFLD